jgi:hypothetical protein
VARALEIAPAHGPALLRAGEFQIMMAFRNGDDPSRGVALLERAAADPQLTRRQRSEVSFYRGMAERALGNEPAARARFSESLAIDASFRPAALAGMA